MFRITFESESKEVLEYLRETAHEKIPEMDEMTVEALDSMIKEPKERTHVTVCNNCGSDFLGYDALVDENNEVVAGPYDNTQCLYCGDIDASVRDIPVEQVRECENIRDCNYRGDKEMMKLDYYFPHRWLCPQCADPSIKGSIGKLTIVRLGQLG